MKTLLIFIFCLFYIVSSNHETATIGFTVRGRPIEAIYFNTPPAHSSRTNQPIIIHFGIHGNEASSSDLGTEIAERWQNDVSLLNGKFVILIPALNKDGIRVGSRYNNQGVDLNRNFPFEFRPSRRYGRRPLDQPESKALYDLIEENTPKIVIAYHSCTRCGGVVNFDGPALEQARAMGTTSGYRVSAVWSTPTPGSFGTYCKHKNLPCITYEFPKRLRRRFNYDPHIRALESLTQIDIPNYTPPSQDGSPTDISPEQADPEPALEPAEELKY